MTKNTHPHFSIYTNIKSTIPYDQISLEELVEIIRAPNDQVKRIRTMTTSYVSTGDKSLGKTITNLKSGLPYITPGGTFTKREDKGLIDYSGVVHIDIDVKDVVVYSVIDELKEAVASLPFVAIAAISPSGCGIKGLAITSNTDPANHTQLVHQVCVLVEDVVRPILEPLGINVGSSVDRCAQALSQAMYITWDRNTFYNPDVVAYEFIPVEGWVDSTPAPKKAKKDNEQEKVKLKTNETRELLPGEKEVLTTKPALVDKSIAAQHKCLSDYVKFLKDVAGTCERYYRPFSYGSFYSIKLIAYANSMGVDQDVLYDWMITAGWTEGEDFARIRDMYSRYVDGHGKGFEYKRIVRAIIPEISDDECLWVPAGGYLSDVIDGSKISKSTHIVAPTGSGKTHLQFEGKQIWVFPTTALCTQFYISVGKVKNAWTKLSVSPNPEGSRDFIITTYDSFVEVCKEVNLSEYTVILDEVHNFITASSVNYKLEALRDTNDLLPMAKRVITLTATPFPNQISTFADYDTIVVKKSDSFKRTVKLISSEESRRADVVNRVVSRGNFSLVFLQKTDLNTLSPWENEFAAKGKKVDFINSQNKGSDEFHELVSNQQVNKENIIIATSVIAEGVSIQTELDVVDVYIMGSEHPALIEQMARRFRKIKELNVFLLTSGDSSGSLTITDLEIAAAGLRDQLGDLAKVMISSIESSGLKMKDANFVGAPVYELNGEYKIDELLIENKIYQKECGLLAGNKKLCMELLNKKYGYEIVEEVEEMNESAKFSYVNLGDDEMIEVAKNIVMGKLYGQRFEEPTDEVFIDTLRKHERFVKKIAKGLPGITKLGKNELRKCFDAFEVWNDKRSEWFIRYVQLLNSGCEVRNKFRQLVMQYCVGVPLTSEQMIGYGSILFDHETLSACARQKSEFMSSLLLACEPKPSTIRTVKSIPKINSSASGDDVEVVGVEQVKSIVKVKTYTPVPERIAFEPALMALNIFGYEKPILSLKQVAVMTDDEQFRNELLTIPGFTF